MTTLIQKIETREAELSERLENMRAEALERFAVINGPSTVQQMHAHIGRNNNIFVDSVRMQFHSPDDFIARWLNGLTQLVHEKRGAILRRRRFGDKKRTEEIIPEMLQVPLLKEYIHLFLERNFYRNFDARVRAKPDDSLWQVWFGSGNLVWGLLISPALRFGEWANDKSQMRRETYAYWTIEHVLETGLIAPETETPVTFSDVDGFLSFYETVLARVSNSEYEKAISMWYIDYVRSHKYPAERPLLIPELRYAGKETKHLYRLDFCVLNAYTMKMTGFEISPSSTHMSIAGIKSKTQKELNGELSKKWGKESDKRNAYFKEYGITTVTFTDAELMDLDACIREIRGALEEHADGPLTIEFAEHELQKAYAAIWL